MSESRTWWRLDKLEYNIRPVKVDGETPTRVHILDSTGDRYEAKVTLTSGYFPTHAEAIAAARGIIRNKMKVLDRQKRRLQDKLDGLPGEDGGE